MAATTRSQAAAQRGERILWKDRANAPKAAALKAALQKRLHDIATLPVVKLLDREVRSPKAASSRSAIARRETRSGEIARPG